jgi:hypothetical protein
MKESKISQVIEPVNAPSQRKPNPTQSMLAFSSRRLLTEKSSVTSYPSLSNVEMETLTIRANMVTAIMKEIPYYNHYRIND